MNMNNKHLMAMMAMVVVMSMSGCMSLFSTSGKDIQRDAAEAAERKQLSEQKQLRNAFLLYQYEKGEFPQYYQQIKGYLADPDVFKDVEIYKYGKDQYAVAYRVTGEVEPVEVIIDTKDKIKKEKPVFIRPKRDVVQNRLYEMDGYRAGGKSKATDDVKLREARERAQTAEEDVKDGIRAFRRNHDSYVD